MVADLVFLEVPLEKGEQVLLVFWKGDPALPADQQERRPASHLVCRDRFWEFVRVLTEVVTLVNVAWALIVPVERHGKEAEKMYIPPEIQDW